MAFLHGYLWGLSLVILIGPVFFTLLQGTLEYGFRSGFAVALGIFISDVVCVALLYGLGVGDFFTNLEHQKWIAIAGGLIVLGLGLKYALRPNVDTDVQLKLSAGKYLGFFVKGFLVNFVNPFVFGVWIGFIGFASTEYPAKNHQILYLVGMLLAILTTDSAKAALAHWIKPLFQPQRLVLVFRLIGITLLGLGIYLLAYGIWGPFSMNQEALPAISYL